MNREQAAIWVQALNLIQPHIAPLMFQALANSDVSRTVLAIANGQLDCTVTPIMAANDLKASAG